MSSYQLDLFLQGASAPFQSIQLGKPSPDSDGTIRVDLTAQFVGWPVPGTVYVADVAAVGPGGVAPSSLSNTFAFGSGCSYGISPLNPSATSAGGAASVSVTAGAGCAWTAASNATWLTVNAGSSGSANGIVNYTVAANTATTTRTGTLTVAGQTVTVTQAGTCNFNVTPTNPNPAAAGGAASLSVTAGSGCSWTTTESLSWVSVSSGGGTGNGTVNYTVSANTSTSSRSGTMTVAGRTVTVTQAGVCSFTVSPTASNFASGGGTGSLTVTVNSGTNCGWTATEALSWVSITAGSSGTGNGTVSYTVSANSATSSRSGSLTVAGKTVTVTEGAASAIPTAPTNVRIKS